jgi:hypothetical protein
VARRERGRSGGFVVQRRYRKRIGEWKIVERYWHWERIDVRWRIV